MGRLITKTRKPILTDDSAQSNILILDQQITSPNNN